MRLFRSSRQRARGKTNQARGSADRSTMELDRVNSELARLAAEYRRVWLRHRPVEQLTGNLACADPAIAVDDADLIDRIIIAYRRANQTALGASDSMWFRALAEPKKPIHEALMRGDRDHLAAILRQPDRSALFYGFENTFDSSLPTARDLKDFWEYQACYDTLCCLAEAIGSKPLPNPENDYHVPPSETLSPDQLVAMIEGEFGFPLEFPNPFVGEIGLATSKGVITYRVVQALYQAWRVAKLTQTLDRPRVLEIGAGLGRTAYYARQFGIRDYTLIDLPMTAVAQGYFLGRTLGAEGICLFGEDRPGIRVLPPAAFIDGDADYDLVLNVDSLTEMAADTARDYCSVIKARAGLFLSINHEANAFPARAVCLESGLIPVARSPYWMRRGYVEELFRCR